MRYVLRCIVSIATVGLSGCAWFTTYSNEVDLEDRSVSIDAKQRVITSHKNQRMDQVVICAEPSPDALAVLGASGALAGSSAAGAGGSGSLGLGEAAASIGLRTQSIQLLRDLNYRICEAYANDAIGYTEASALLRRGQSTMMGLIAIEQLTGPVVATQVTLSSAVTAGTGGASADVTAAQTAVAAAKEKLLKAQAEVDAARTAHEEKLDAAAEASAKLSEAAKGPNPDQAVVDSHKASLKTARAAAKVSEDALRDKQRRAKSAEEELAESRVRLAKAERGQTGAGVMAAGQLGEVARANAENTQALAKEVRGIVEDINKSYFIDTCFSLVNRVIEDEQAKSARVDNTKTTMEKERADALETALTVCTRILSGQATSLRMQ